MVLDQFLEMSLAIKPLHLAIDAIFPRYSYIQYSLTRKRHLHALQKYLKASEENKTLRQKYYYLKMNRLYAAMAMYYEIITKPETI